MTRVLLITDACDDRGRYAAEPDAIRSAAIDELDVRGGTTVTAVRVELALNPTPGSAFDDARAVAIGGVVDGTSAVGSELRRLVDTADAVLIAGCALSDANPDRLFELSAVGRLAAARQLPVVLTGVRIGPRLTERQRSAVDALVAVATTVSVTDESSVVVSGTADGVATVQPHEGAFLRGASIDLGLPEQYVAMVVHAFPGAGEPGPLESLAAFARHVHATTSLPVVVFPTAGAIEGPSDAAADVGLAGLLAAAVGDLGTTIAAPLLPARELATACRRAAVVVATRVMPVAVAVAAGVPAMAITTDTAHHAMLSAALAHGGLRTWQAPLIALAGHEGAERFDELWSRREEIADHLVALQPAMRAVHERHWDLVHAALTRRETTSSAAASLPERTVRSHTDLRRTELLDALQRTQLEQLHDAFDGAEHYALSLRDLVDARDAEVRDLRAHVAELERELAGSYAEQTRLADEARDSRSAAMAAQQLAATLSEWPTSTGEAARIALIEQHAWNVQREIDALHRTILFRSARIPRSIYARLRRLLRMSDNPRRS